MKWAILPLLLFSLDGPRPLDLPAPGVGGPEDNEDIPESILFYGGAYEGDGFFWCLDRSCSMGWGPGLAVLKQEMTQAISQLSGQTDFGIVAFGSNVLQWAPSPRRGTSAYKESANAWVQGLTADGGTCIAAGGVATVELANQSTKRLKRIIVLTDGEPYCSGLTDEASVALTNITAANFQRIPIDTVYISADAGGIAFCQQLSAMNNGTASNP